MSDENHICGYRRVQGMVGSTVFKLPETDHYREDGRCSYCGSVSQEVFLAFVEAGGEVGPTDKNYKAYLHSTETVTAPGGKFYFYHLDDAGCARFIELYNEKKMKLGYPGRFYSLPYFCTRRAP